jgi:MobA/VirD2-like, nuclease domain/TraI-like middle domain
VIAKEVATPRAGGSFRRLVTYLTSSHGKTERLGAVRLTHCVSSDVASAVLEVESAQARNSRARHRSYHLILAFPAGEEPAVDVLGAIERRACEALGFAEHQRLSVVHHDTDHLHVHIAINRVHPRTHRAHSPSYSKLVLDRLCVELEQEHGLQPTAHRTRQRAAHLDAGHAAAHDPPRKAARRAPDSERLGGVESLIGFIQRECAESLRAARSWSELHQAAARRGLRVRLRGNGLVLVTGDGLAAKGSRVARDLSKAALERRLGAFEFAATDLQPARSGYERRLLVRDERSSRLYERYRQEREATREARARTIARLRQQRDRDEHRLEHISQRRWAAVRLVAKGRVAWALWSAYAKQADRRDRQRARARYRARVRAAAAQHRTPGWREWLRTAGQPAARTAGPSGVRKAYGAWPRSEASPQTLADLRDLSALPVIRFGEPPDLLPPAAARRDVEQRGAQQPDRGARSDPAQRRIDTPAHQRGGRKRG